MKPAAILSLILAPATLSAGELQWGAELGYQSALMTSDRDLAKSLIYAEPSLKYGFELTPGQKWASAGMDPPAATLIEINASARGWFDPQAVRPLDRRGFNINQEEDLWSWELGVRAASIGISRGKWRMVAGFQEIAWGETFGAPVLDLVNPRDLRDPLLFDPAWVRVPVAALQGQLFLDKLTLQGVLNPFPRHNHYPVSGSRFDPTLEQANLRLENEVAGEDPKFGEFAEFGGKASYLFESGLDIGIIYYRHWNRTLVYELRPESATSAALVPIEEPVHTIGASLSYSDGPIVLRSDIAFHWDHPLQENAAGIVEQGGQLLQTVFGADLTTDDSWTFGLQGQLETSFLSSGYRSFQWVSARVSKKLFGDALEPEVYVLAGFNNPDLWVQPKLTWYFAERFTASLRADILGKSNSPGDGLLWPVSGQSRLHLWISMKL